MDKEFQEILKTEYSTSFDEHRKKAMINSYYKYGPARKNYQEHRCIDAVANICKRLERYEETGNTEFLVDVANFAMLEFMFPSKDGAGYKPTGADDCALVGFGVNQLQGGEIWKGRTS